eukprot:7914019-Karenia_brevis.AAC.1
MYQQSEKRLEIVVKEEEVLMHKYPDLSDAPVEERSATWAWMVLKEYVLPTIQGHKVLEGVAPAGNLARQLQAWVDSQQEEVEE